MDNRLKTAEIKRLLRECVDDGSIHPIEDFKQYISQKTGKTYTVGQLSGAISQLTALGELDNVERGLYRKGGGESQAGLPYSEGQGIGEQSTGRGREQSGERGAGQGGERSGERGAGQGREPGAGQGTERNTGYRGFKEFDELGEFNEENEEYQDEQNQEMWAGISALLTETEKALAGIVGGANVWNLSSREFERLKEVKRLGRQMKAVAADCGAGR